VTVRNEGVLLHPGAGFPSGCFGAGLPWGCQYASGGGGGESGVEKPGSKERASNYAASAAPQRLLQLTSVSI